MLPMQDADWPSEVNVLYRHVWMLGVISLHHETPYISHTAKHPKTLQCYQYKTKLATWNDSIFTISTPSCKQNWQNKLTINKQIIPHTEGLTTFLCSFNLYCLQMKNTPTSTTCHTEFLKTRTTQFQIIMHDINSMNQGNSWTKSNTHDKHRANIDKPSSRTPHIKHKQ